jgi:hypothetical protein
MQALWRLTQSNQQNDTAAGQWRQLWPAAEQSCLELQLQPFFGHSEQIALSQLLKQRTQ